MVVVLLAILSCLLHTAVAVPVIVAHPRQEGRWEVVTGMVVITVSTLSIVVLGLGSCYPNLRHGIAAGLTCVNLATALGLRWRAFRNGIFAHSRGRDFALVAAAATGWTATVLWLAVAMYRHQPFLALVLGILGFFLSVNAVAEVYVAGARGRSSPAPDAATDRRRS